jgi:hypothetical protein
MTYDVGDAIRLSVTFTDIDGDPTDPTNVSFVMVEPDGIETSLSVPPIVNSSVGVYHVDWMIAKPGPHYWRFIGTGDVAAVETGAFTVRGYTGYPKGIDLALFLLEAKTIGSIPVTIPDSYDRFVLAAIQAFEKETGWNPFLAVPGGSAGNETRSFDVCGSRVYLPVGLVTLDELKLRGDAMTEEEDFWLEDHRHAPPYTWIEFRNCYYGRRVLEITGVWGYTDTLPDDVRLAILSYAAMSLSNSLSGPGGELTKVRQDDVQYDFAASASGGMGQIASWGQAYKAVVARYRRVQLA